MEQQESAMPDHGTEIPSVRLRGVNLGGWLLLEKWMTPSLFEGLAAADETTWCAKMGPAAQERLRNHWEHFISKPDFQWLAGVGINVARRYRGAPALYGIQMLNEPHKTLPTDLLKAYYLRAYDAIRAHCPPDRVAVVFHDGFRSHREYLGFMRPPQHENVIYDVHRYQCFEPGDIEMDIHDHLQMTGNQGRREPEKIQRDLGLPAIVGEWSLGFDPEHVALWPGPFNHALRHMEAAQQEIAYRAFAAAQLLAFEHYHGWFFWSYRTETTPEWSLRKCIERGWLPHRFQ
jgi:glucan 1,3-beta-glucosidase